MRLLIATGNRTVEGGCESYLKALLPALSSHGYELGLLYETERDGRARIDSDLGLEHVWQLRGLTETPEWAGVMAWSPEVIFCNGMYSRDLERCLTRFPMVYFTHNYYGTCLSGFKRFAFPTPQPCHRTVGWGCLLHYYPHRCGGLNPLIMVADFRLQHEILQILRACSYVVVASKAMRQEYLRHGFSEEQIKLAPLFPTQYVPDAHPPGPRAWTGLILLMGRLSQVKGGEYLVKALRLIRDRELLDRPLRLAMVGAGPEESTWAQLARECGVPVTFHGWLAPGQAQTLIREADLLVVPSLWPEPFGLAGIEAGCLGTPSVGYAHGGIPDWLVEGESGVLAPSPPTVEGLADAIVQALGNAEYHQGLRLGAWRTAQGFSLEKHLRLLEDVLESAAMRTRAAETVGSGLS